MNERTLAPETSPLLEATGLEVNDLITQRIDAIFNKKPPFSSGEIEFMVKYYRNQRLSFQANEEAGLRAKPEKRKAKAKPDAKAEVITRVDDLF